MTRGRPKDPVSEKTGAGNRAKRGEEKPRDLMPVEASLVIPPPEDLGEYAANVWRDCISDMATLRVLRQPDLLLLNAYCKAAQRHHDIGVLIDRLGPLVTENGRTRVNPLLSAESRAFNDLRHASEVLGLNPMARIRGNLMEVAAANQALSLRDRLLAKVEDE